MIKNVVADGIYDTKRPRPCDGCKLYNVCAKDKVDCFAFRRWVNDGDYRDRQVAHIIRPLESDDNIFF